MSLGSEIGKQELHLFGRAATGPFGEQRLPTSTSASAVSSLAGIAHRLLHLNRWRRARRRTCRSRTGPCPAARRRRRPAKRRWRSPGPSRAWRSPASPPPPGPCGCSCWCGTSLPPRPPPRGPLLLVRAIDSHWMILP